MELLLQNALNRQTTKVSYLTPTHCLKLVLTLQKVKFLYPGNLILYHLVFRSLFCALLTITCHRYFRLALHLKRKKKDDECVLPIMYENYTAYIVAGFFGAFFADVFHLLCLDRERV